MLIDTETCNMALAHISDGIEIGDIDSDRTAPARVLKQFYPTALGMVHRDLRPRKHTKVKALAELEHDNSEWTYAYRLPIDCYFPLRIQTGDRNDTEESMIEFDLGSDDGGPVLFTDEPEAVLEYVYLIDNPLRWDPDFKMAFTFLLGHLIAPKLTGGDQFKLGDKCLQKYGIWKSTAIANDLNSRKKTPPTGSGLFRARG